MTWTRTGNPPSAHAQQARRQLGFLQNGSSRVLLSSFRESPILYCPKHTAKLLQPAKKLQKCPENNCKKLCAFWDCQANVSYKLTNNWKNCAATACSTRETPTLIQCQRKSTQLNKNIELGEEICNAVVSLSLTYAAFEPAVTFCHSDTYFKGILELHTKLYFDCCFTVT